jgi:hypothetical protein
MVGGGGWGEGRAGAASTPAASNDAMETVQYLLIGPLEADQLIRRLPHTHNMVIHHVPKP